MLYVSVIILAIGIGLMGWAISLLSSSKQIIDKAKFDAKALLTDAERKAGKTISEANSAGERAYRKAEVAAMEVKQAADNEVIAKRAQLAKLDEQESFIKRNVTEAFKALQKQTDLSGSKASLIDFISDDELMESSEYQKDRNELRKQLKKLSENAFRNDGNRGSIQEVARFAAITAKSDMAGALLLTTAEMLCSQMTTSNGQTSMDKLMDTIAATESLMKAMDHAFFVSPTFVASLKKRLDVELHYKRAKEAARERQRELREQEREERTARVEAEQALKEAKQIQKITERAVAEAEQRLLAANQADRASFASELERLRNELVEAQEKSKRAISRAQETKQGHVYIISNIGSFGENVFKIGMTRRLDPMDRIKELGDASVPFGFDIHAMIESNDAPSLEADLHRAFTNQRLNKVNTRKEFFRISIADISEHFEVTGISASIRLVPSADEYYASIHNHVASNVELDSSQA